MSDDDRPLIVFPVASRFDTNDLPGMQVSLKSYHREFRELFERVYD
jgi:hypothetical protein